jgi:hypothetical protein
VVSKLSSLGQPIARGECDNCLLALALVAPSAAATEENVERKFDLYFSLFERAGVTLGMLQQACAAYAMAPLKGRPKFFPDPGALYELMADDARRRKRDLIALHRARDVLDGKIKPDEEPEAYVSREKMRCFADSLPAFACQAKRAAGLHEPEPPHPYRHREKRPGGVESGPAAPLTSRCNNHRKDDP